uniref:homeobox protein EMX1-like n=1 Tax=Styela clava TaxID=7725 RepID=UPI001939493F|nr:homeobox protein EMX1-like [Styela clava]
MISYRHPYQALSNAQWTPFVRFNYAGVSDLEEITTRKRKFSSDDVSDSMKVTVVNQKSKICHSSIYCKPVAKFNNHRNKKKHTLFTIDAILGHSTESPSKKRKLQNTQPTIREDDSLDSGFSSFEDVDKLNITRTDGNGSEIYGSDPNKSRPESSHSQSSLSQSPRPKIRSNGYIPPTKCYNHMYKYTNDSYYFHPGLSKVVQQNWMYHKLPSISYVPIETKRSVGKDIKPNVCFYSSTPKPQKLKSKRARTVFTQKQLEHLENKFNNQQYIVGIERRALANKLRLTDAQVKIWFQNRRIKYRNDNKRQLKKETNKLDVLKREAIR